MAASFDVFFDLGGTDGSPGTTQDTSGLGPPNIRFKTADDATIDSNDPISVPAAGSNYSYWKHVYLKCGTAPSTQVDNVKFYTDEGGFGTDIVLHIGSPCTTKSSVSDDGYEVADGADFLSGNHTLISGTVDAFGYGSVSAYGPLTISEDGAIINASGETCDYLVLQMAVGASASAGNLTDETLTFVYDEI